jgi:hypothetical protein
MTAMRSKKSPYPTPRDLAKVRADVNRLAGRVEFLEKALKEQPPGSAARATTRFRHQVATLSARSTAIQAYLDRDRTPEQIESYRRYKAELNAHLRNFGFPEVGEEGSERPPRNLPASSSVATSVRSRVSLQLSTAATWRHSNTR